MANQISWNSGLSRRDVLRYTLAGSAALSLGGVAGCGVSGGGNPGGTVNSDELKRWQKADLNWKRFDGTTLVVQVQKHPWPIALQPHLAAFTALTGITVQVVTAGESDMLSKLATELQAGSPTPDVMLVPAYPQYVASHWLAPLGGYLRDRSLTDPSFYDANDMFPVAKSFVGWESGEFYGVPITTEVETIFYRSDLVDAPMGSYDQLLAAATAARTGGRSGIALRGKAESTMAWTCQGFVFGNGGYMIDPDGRPALDSPETIAAVEYYAELLQKAGPAGAASWDWQQVNQAFEGDKAAIILESSVFAGEYYDPKKNPKANQVAAAAFPTNGHGLRPNFWHWVLGVNANSKNREAAWLFLMWATSPPTSALLGNSAVAVPRQSVWASAGFRSAYNAQAADVVLSMLKSADSDPYAALYTNKSWPKVGTEFSIAMSSVIAGEQRASAALKSAQVRASHA